MSVKTNIEGLALRMSSSTIGWARVVEKDILRVDYPTRYGLTGIQFSLTEVNNLKSNPDNDVYAMRGKLRAFKLTIDESNIHFLPYSVESVAVPDPTDNGKLVIAKREVKRMSKTGDWRPSYIIPLANILDSAGALADKLEPTS